MLAYRIEEMSCGHCVSTIARAVRDVDADARVEADLAARIVRVQSSAATADEIADALAEAGYTPVPVAAAVAPAEAPRSGCCGGCS